MKIKIRNEFNDIVFFWIYHSLALALSLFLLITLSFKIPFNDFAAIFKAIQALNMPEAEATQLPTAAVVKMLKGQVLVSDSSLDIQRNAKEGEVLKKGDVIQTLDKSFALLTFNGKYSWSMRIIPNSLIEIDKLMETSNVEKKEESLFNLIRGGVLFLLTKGDEKPEVKIKTSFVSFGIRGTKLAILLDDDYSILSVHSGVVEAENFINYRRSSVAAGNTYIANRTGKMKLEAASSIMNLYDWNMNQTEGVTPDINTVISTMGPLSSKTEPDVEDNVDSKTVSVNPKENIKDNETAVANAIQSYTDELSHLSQMAKSLEGDLAAKVNNYNTNKELVAEDIFCLESGSTDCMVHSKDLLMSRGFPRVSGPPRVRKSMANDLRLYLKESEDNIRHLENEISLTKNEIAKKEKILKELLHKYKDGQN